MEALRWEYTRRFRLFFSSLKCLQEGKLSSKKNDKTHEVKNMRLLINGYDLFPLMLYLCCQMYRHNEICAVAFWGIKA